jgi:hypothetical protein
MSDSTPTPPQMKRCTKCSKEKPATFEYFNRRAQGKNGMCSHCKECENNKMKSWRDNNLDRARQVERSRYYCRVEHYRAKTRNQKRKTKEKNNDYSRRYHALNKERINRRSRAYHLAHQGEIGNRKQRWYRSGGKIIVKTIGMKRRARHHNLPDSFTSVQWSRCLDHFQHRCAACGRPAGLWHTLAGDHWVAIADLRPDNPGTVAWNIVPLCHGIGGCNNSKGDKDPVEWLNGRYGKRKAAEILKRITDYFECVKRGD